MPPPPPSPSPPPCMAWPPPFNHFDDDATAGGPTRRCCFGRIGGPKDWRGHYCSPRCDGCDVHASGGCCTNTSTSTTGSIVQLEEQQHAASRFWGRRAVQRAAGSGPLVARMRMLLSLLRPFRFHHLTVWMYRGHFTQISQTPNFRRTNSTTCVERLTCKTDLATKSTWQTLRRRF